MNTQGQAPVFCRITVDGERTSFSIQRSIIPERWDKSKGRARGTTDEAQQLNAYITLVRSRIYEHQHKLEENKQPISADVLRDLMVGKSHGNKSRGLFQVFHEHNEKVKVLIGQDYAHDTWQRYKTCLKLLCEFVQWKYKVSEYPLRDVNFEFITEFDHYLRAVRNCGNNTTVKYIKNFKKVIRIALANSWIEADPFLNYKARLKNVDRGYLTQEELDTIGRKEIAVTFVAQA
jgi:hypothetical protein